MSDDLIKRAEEAAPYAPNRDLLFALAARIRELEAAQGVGYTGKIEPGMRFVWEHGNPHAECEIMVTEVRERQSDERAIYSISKDAKQPVWNDESRFREAVRPALTPAPVRKGFFSEGMWIQIIDDGTCETPCPAPVTVEEAALRDAARVLLDALGNEYQPQNKFWAAIINNVSKEADVTRIRGSDGILIALRALSGGEEG